MNDQSSFMFRGTLNVAAKLARSVVNFLDWHQSNLESAATNMILHYLGDEKLTNVELKAT
jgi:hypothetical protein